MGTRLRILRMAALVSHDLAMSSHSTWPENHFWKTYSVLCVVLLVCEHLLSCPPLCLLRIRCTPVRLTESDTSHSTKQSTWLRADAQPIFAGCVSWGNLSILGRAAGLALNEWPGWLHFFLACPFIWRIFLESRKAWRIIETKYYAAIITSWTICSIFLFLLHTF